MIKKSDRGPPPLKLPGLFVKLNWWYSEVNMLLFEGCIDTHLNVFPEMIIINKFALGFR